MDFRKVTPESMFPAGQHPFYSYTDEDRRIILESVGIKEAELERDTAAIKDWIQKQPHLADAGIDSHAAGLYIIMAKGSVEKAKQRIEYYFTTRGTMLEIRDRAKLLNDRTRPVFDCHVIAPVPKLYKGARVTFMKVTDWNNFTMEGIIMNMAMIADIRYANDLMNSDLWIVDLENITMGHVLKTNLMALAKGYKLLRDGVGLKISGIHIVNCTASSTIQAVFNICKQVLAKKLIERIKFHDTLQDLHEVLPKEYLLEDYGGDLPSYEVYKDKIEKMVTDEKTVQYLLDACKLVSDESKRLKTDAYNKDYLPGNFKKLDLD